MVKPGRCELRRSVGSGGSAGSTVATDDGFDGWTSTTGGLLSLAVSSAPGVLSGDDESVVVSVVVPRCGLRPEPAPGVPAEPLCWGPAEPSEVESALEGAGSSAWAIPLPNPTATQADSKNAATINRSHQSKDDLPVFGSLMRFVDNRTPLAR
jgi:hypothetical protein